MNAQQLHEGYQIRCEKYGASSVVRIEEAEVLLFLRGWTSTVIKSVDRAIEIESLNNAIAVASYTDHPRRHSVDRLLSWSIVGRSS